MIQRFSASVASRHMACHASANLEVAIPNWVEPEIDPSADNAANRGTEMHKIMADVMALTTKDGENFAKAVAYIAEVRKRRRFSILIEEPVDAVWLLSKPGTTADLVLYVKDEIHILDLKTGRIPVEAQENSQLLFYAASYGYLAPHAEGVHLHIVQPWADNMTEWFASATRVRQFMTEARLAEADIRHGDTSFMPGDHCMFCPANPRSRAPKGRPYCPALMELYFPMAVDEDAMLASEE